MTPFVDAYFNRQLLPPWISEGARHYGFVVRVPEGCVRGYLDTYLNGTYPERAPFYYAPLSSPNGSQFGLFNVAIHPKVSSQAAHEAPGWDTVRHTEVYWTVPVCRWNITPDNLLTDPKTVWVQPFCVDDNPTLVFGSREIWGGDIVVGTITPDPYASRDDGLHLDVALDGFRVFNPSSQPERLACFHAVIDGGARIELEQALAINPDMAPLASLLQGSGMFAGQAAAADSDAVKGAELNNLKQFRDADDMRLATYRAIVESRSWHSNINNLQFYAPGKARVDVFWSASMAEILSNLFDIDGKDLRNEALADHAGPAIPDENHIFWNLPRAALQVELAYSFTSDIKFKVVETLHTYGG